MTSVSLGSKKLEVVLPRFHFHSISVHYGFRAYIEHGGQSFTSIAKGYRHMSLAEVVDLMKYNSEDEDNSRKNWDTFSSLLLAYLLERGIDLKRHEWRRGIYTNNGMKREGQNLIIFRNLDGKLEEICEPVYDTVIGYKIKTGVKIESRRFSLERMFRKYREKLKREFGDEAVPLKNIDKSDSDFVEYLFGQEYEDLPQMIQKAEFILPYDSLEREKGSCWQECSVSLLSLDLSFSPKPQDDRSSNFESMIELIEFNKLALNRLTIYPGQTCEGFHLLVREGE